MPGRDARRLARGQGVGTADADMGGDRRGQRKIGEVRRRSSRACRKLLRINGLRQADGRGGGQNKAKDAHHTPRNTGCPSR